MHHRTMSRTTLSLDDDILPPIRVYARTRSLTLGKAVSDLVRRGLRAPAATKELNGVRVFDLPANSRSITSKAVKQLESQTE